MDEGCGFGEVREVWRHSGRSWAFHLHQPWFSGTPGPGGLNTAQQWTHAGDQATGLKRTVPHTGFIVLTVSAPSTRRTARSDARRCPERNFAGRCLIAVASWSRTRQAADTERARVWDGTSGGRYVARAMSVCTAE